MTDVEQQTGEVQIVCRHNGPIRVTGKFVIKDPDGNVFDTSGKDFVSLCRCGHSANKPFCDGAHKTAGFESEMHAKGVGDSPQQIRAASGTVPNKLEGMGL
jgi:CDGSH-type Zn-finger protein